MKWFGLIIFFSSMIAFAGCSKGGSSLDDNDWHISTDGGDTTIPLVIINTPLDNQVFTNGDIIKVDGKVTDNSLYRGSIKITDDASGAVIKEQLYEIHGLESYNFSIEYKTSVTAVANYKVIVQFEDHGLNANTKSVKVKVNP